MKAIFEDAITKHICLLCEKFHPFKIDKLKITELVKFYRNSTDKVGDEELEKIIACIYALQERGIPLKASSGELKISTENTLRLFKKLKTPSIEYVPLFVELLKIGYENGKSEEFDKLFKKLKPRVLDYFALATVLNMVLKKSNSYFGYSEPTIIKYRKLIKGEING